MQFARAGHPTVLCGRDAKHVARLNAERRNDEYLPRVEFPPLLSATADLDAALGSAREVLLVVPSRGIRPLLVAIKKKGVALTGLSWATKGFELDTGLLPHQVVATLMPPDLPTAVLSGPTFAKEVGAGLPSALTVASQNEQYARRLAEAISTDTFRAYTSGDIMGVEVGGATKNVYAIGAGISDGLGFGANTRIALVTRGLAEMMRLGQALGARKETFMGLAGVGDLVLTCTDDQSRNRRFGLALAAGKTPEAARREIGQVVEGYFSAQSARLVAVRHGVDMPIVEQIYRVLYEGLAPRDAVTALMRRPITADH